MICRLCLDETEFYFSFQNAQSQENEAAEKTLRIIRKYFDVPVDINSDVVCNVCCRQLNDFHAFRLRIKKKQKEWQSKKAAVISKSVDTLVGRVAATDAEENALLEKDDGEHETNIKEYLQEIKDVELIDPLNCVAIILESDITASKDVTETTEDSQTERTEHIISNGEEHEIFDKRIHYDLYIAKHAGTLKCDLCSQTLENFEQVWKHFKSEHNCQGYVTCCNKRFSLRRRYAEHLKWHLNPNAFKCEPCNHVYKSRNSYEAHKRRYHAKPEDLKFQCSYCPMKFLSNSLLKTHFESRHNSMQGQYKCEECNKELKTIVAFKAHQKNMHLHESMTTCDICGKIFTYKSNCDIHKKTVHQNAELTKVECPTCHRWFKNSCVLKHHVRGKHREDVPREHTCDVCGIVKTSTNSLNAHKRYHHSDVSFDCSICSKKFKFKRTLQEHISSHTGIPNYSCNFCSRTFNVHANMVKHKKLIHKDEYEAQRRVNKYKPKEKK